MLFQYLIETRIIETMRNNAMTIAYCINWKTIAHCCWIETNMYCKNSGTMNNCCWIKTMSYWKNSSTMTNCCWIGTMLYCKIRRTGCHWACPAPLDRTSSIQIYCTLINRENHSCYLCYTQRPRRPVEAQCTHIFESITLKTNQYMIVLINQQTLLAVRDHRDQYKTSDMHRSVDSLPHHIRRTWN